MEACSSAVLSGEATFAVQCARAEDVCDALPDSCIDLIVTDHPYHGVKDHDWDNEHDTDAAFLDWTHGMVRRYQRILKPNGSLYVFASPDMGGRVECVVRESMRVLTNIRWEKPAFSTKAEMFEKEALRSPFPASETIIFAEHYGADNMAMADEGGGYFFDPIRNWMVGEWRKSGLSKRAVNEALGSCTSGSGMAGHYFRERGLPWEMPTRSMYERAAACIGGELLLRDWQDVRREYDALRTDYEAKRRPFNVSAAVPYTDVWHYKTVSAYDGKHPCEKPRDMAEDIINASSRPGAVVADFFAGSGVFLAEAVRLGRRAIGCDMDPHWAAATVRKIQNPGLRSPKPARKVSKNQTLLIDLDVE